MERDFAAYLFTLFCPLFTSGASFSIAHEYSVSCERSVTADLLLGVEAYFCDTTLCSAAARYTLHSPAHAFSGV